MKTGLLHRVRLVLGIVLVMAVVFVADVALDMDLYRFGIIPGDLSGLSGILIAPFIHGGSSHLVANLTGFVLLSGICLLNSIRHYVLGSLFVVVVGGLLVWVFGRASIHIGASGWIFGLWGICIASALFHRGWLNILMALLAIIFYGGMVYGLLPGKPGISFESHLFGVLAGVIFSWLQPNKIKEF